MTSQEAALRDIVAALRALDVPFALVGGLAVSVRTEPRFTRDSDFAVALPDDVAAERLVHALLGRGYEVKAVLEQEAVGRLATVRLARSGELLAPVTDLLFASSGIEPEVAADAEPIELLSGLIVPVARTGHLIALKVLSRDDVRRPQDIADLRALLRVAGPEDIALARESLLAISARGYHRNRDLLGDLEDLVRTTARTSKPDNT